MNSLESYERCTEKLEAQRRYCAKNQKPIFADGLFCPYCNESIYTWVSKEQAAEHHITSCPVCHKTFCD